ncbi:MAG: M1 family metallopeptidase [Candidatus Aminicenantes bacterium]|nr:M1 family metallopeptidase [Candidatus Aminicenantes bacterium]
MKRSALLLIAGVLVFSVSSSGGLSRQVVAYDLKARLQTDTKTVEGQEVLTWLNESEDPVSELQFHLYMNAFKNNRTTFMKESGRTHRGFKADEENWGRIEVRKISIRDGDDLTGTMAFIRPDDQNPDDQTVMKVTLPLPVNPREKITLVIDFATKLPKVFARSGFVGDFFMVGQWFPKIGVLKDGVWNCHQYHAQSEFFADYGAFRVELTVPARYVVGATGKRISETQNADGSKTYVHVQEDVHDFAWTACPEFVEFREKFSLKNPPVETEMIFLIHRRHLGQKDRYVRALRQGLEFYSTSYGPYPYETITLVDPAPGAAAAGGMEYPTLFTADTTSFMPRGVRMPEMVTIHEFGHGYWYGIVGSNEFEEAWLDEGINSYSEAKAMDKYYGPDGSMIDFLGLRIGEIPFQRMSVIASGRFDPIDKFSWAYVSGGSYSLNVYQKASLMLLTLERLLGEDVMSRIMKTYYEEWKFRHPTTKDFIRVAEKVSGKDLAWFFDQVLYSPDRLDYGISDLASFEVLDPLGMFDGLPAKETPAVKGAKFPAAPKQFRSEVVAARFGEWIFPQEILVVFSDGSRVRETWDGRDRWKRFVYVKPVKAVSAEVDPDRKLVLDANITNNSRVIERARRPVLKYTLGFVGWFQALLSLVSL